MLCDGIRKQSIIIQAKEGNMFGELKQLISDFAMFYAIKYKNTQGQCDDAKYYLDDWIRDTYNLGNTDEK